MSEYRTLVERLESLDGPFKGHKFKSIYREAIEAIEGLQKRVPLKPDPMNFSIAEMFIAEMKKLDKGE